LTFKILITVEYLGEVLSNLILNYWLHPYLFTPCKAPEFNVSFHDIIGVMITRNHNIISCVSFFFLIL
jgi:hypothetical protein